MVGRIGLLAAYACAACGFDRGTYPADVHDVLPDVTEQLGSCKAVKTQQPAATSGDFVIDPDGSGSEMPLSVFCDMATAGGGWTVVFFPNTTNVQAPPAAYTRSTPTLLADATEALLAYRTSAQAVVRDYATFALPADWKTATPFTQTGRDITLPVQINAGTAVDRMVRFGAQSFSDVCEDPWLSGLTWGRVCIRGTTAPYYTGFAVPDPDTCGASNQTFPAADECESELRFSIAVR